MLRCEAPEEEEEEEWLILMNNIYTILDPLYVLHKSGHKLTVSLTWVLAAKMIKTIIRVDVQHQAEASHRCSTSSRSKLKKQS